MKHRARKRRFVGPVGPRIKALREAKGLSQKALGIEIDVHETAVSHWENGVSLPDVDKLTIVAEALATTVINLIEGESAFASLGQMIGAAAS